MRIQVVISFCLALALCAPLCAQVIPPEKQRPQEESDPVRLPNGKLQSDAILKADYEKSLEDSRELARLADELKMDLEKSDRYVLSIQIIKKTEQIEKLAKRIRERMKRS